MNQLDIALAARAFRQGRALRTAIFRHRKFVGKPLTVVLWQLGAEPFSAAAIAYGTAADSFELVVAGDPRNRDLAFAALLRFAHWFNPPFEKAFGQREMVDGGHPLGRSKTAPQVMVANDATIQMLWRLGRRLAYLPTTGEKAAPPELVRLGQHFLFLHRHAAVPGQQLVLSLTDLVAQHWATPQSDMERLFLPALDAYIDPPRGTRGFDAAAAAETHSIGPAPDGDDDTRLEPLMERLNSQRAGRTDQRVVKPLLGEIETHYRELTKRAWKVMWRCWDREMSWPEAASAGRRWDEDRDAYTQHMDWTLRDGRRRTRETPRQAAVLLRKLEDAKSMLDMEEACDDPVRMVPYLLENKAVQGTVISVNTSYAEVCNVKRVRRPLITIESPDPCVMPIGKKLWWTRSPDGAGYVVHDLRAGKGGHTAVTLKLTTSSGVALPQRGKVVCFSVLAVPSFRYWMAKLPPSDPWTHRPAVSATVMPTIEE